LPLAGGSGVISSSNSLTGSSGSGDLVGFSGITVLPNGNYVVASPAWSTSSVLAVGAVTLVSGSTGLALTGGSGTISASNSLTGSQFRDEVGLSGTTLLPNGNYIVNSPNWANGSAGSAGAVTRVSGSTGLALANASGTVSTSNSFTGSQANDQVGSGGITLLANGNFVVDSPNWIAFSEILGAVTLVKGATGLALADGAGTPAFDNNLGGGTTNDHVGSGGVTVLGDGNYIVDSPSWANGSASNAGAVTLISGATGLPLNSGIFGNVTTSDSLTGSQTNDQVGSGAITVQANGNYLVNSPLWANGSAAQAGAVTLVSGSTGLALEGSATITPQNSLLGQQPNAQLTGQATSNQTILAQVPAGWSSACSTRTS